MKKIISVVLILGVIVSLGQIKAEENIIPNEAIRLRVVANSNTTNDQEIKIKVRNQLQKDLYNLLNNEKGIDNARKIINDNLDIIDKNIKDILDNENYALGYKINFGSNYFPEKKYKGITYKEGYYESLLVTLGSGEGDNWWCVLFPPLCLLEAEESDEVEYKFFIQEIIEKYL